MYPRPLRFMQKKHILYVNSEEGRDDFIMVGIFVYSNKIGVQKSVLLDFTENSA